MLPSPLPPGDRLPTWGPGAGKGARKSAAAIFTHFSLSAGGHLIWILRFIWSEQGGACCAHQRGETICSKSMGIIVEQLHEHRCSGGSSLFWAEMITHKLASIQCVHNVIILQQNVLIKSLCLGKVWVTIIYPIAELTWIPGWLLTFPHFVVKKVDGYLALT